MTIKWLQLTGGAMYGERGPAFSGAAERRAMEALKQLEAEMISQYDGQSWLAQGGYERVSLDLEYRADKKGRPLRSARDVGRLLTPGYSVVWPELEQAETDEIVEHLRPLILEALEFVGERKELGKLPKAGDGSDLVAVPIKPLVDDPTPYADEPGDSFVITREFPPNLEPSEAAKLLSQYEEQLEDLLSDEAMNRIVDTETSLTAVRWVVRADATDE